MKLYHSDLFIPAALRARAEKIEFRKLAWSRHAQLELIRDKYGLIPADKIPHSFDARGWELIELEADGEKITKVVYRRPVDSWRSQVIVLRPEWSGAVVTTTWTNRTDDKHATLDKTKYATS